MGQETGDTLDHLTSPRLSLSLNWFILQMISTNRNTSDGEEGEEVELELLNPPVPTETADRAAEIEEESIIEDGVAGVDIGSDGGSEDEERGEPGKESDEDDDEDSPKTFAEIFKIHLKNFIEIPKVDPITKEKITVSSALGKGFLAAIFLALR